jgi:hypothetical protein
MLKHYTNHDFHELFGLMNAGDIDTTSKQNAMKIREHSQ